MNQLGEYHSVGPDIELSGEVSDDYSIGRTASDEWLMYTVDVTPETIRSLSAGLVGHERKADSSENRW